MIRLPLFCLILVGLSPDDTVELRPHWKVGDTARYHVMKSFEKTKGEATVLQGASWIDQEFEVIQASDDGYVLKVTNAKAVTVDPRLAANPLGRETARLAEGLELIIEVGPQGGFQGVQNWKAVQEVLLKLAEESSSRLREAGLDEKTAATFRSQMASLVATKAQIEVFCTREMQFLFATLGWTHETSSPIGYEAELPNPFGGEPFPAKGMFTLIEVNREAGRARVDLEQSIPPDEASRILGKSLADLAKRVGRELPEGELPDSISIDEHGEFWMDVGTGWLRSVTWKRTSKIGDQSRIDTIEIRRKEG